MGENFRPPLVDMARHAHLSGNFAPQREEVHVTDLDVIGEIPADLSGSYIRNGPNPRFDPIGRYVYPIDGDGMVHRIELSEGHAHYTNRFIRTPMVETEECVGYALWAGVTDAYRPGVEDVGIELAGTCRELPDINLVQHGERLLAMAEATPPYRLDPVNLHTLGRDTYNGAMAIGSTAHPKIDPKTGELVIFNYALESPYLTWSVVSADGSVTRPPTPIDGIDSPLMIHDMALTDRYVVLFLCPLVFDITALLEGSSPLDWQPDRGTRVALIPRDGGPVRWASCEAFWVWHFAGACDLPDGRVQVDYAQWEYPSAFARTGRPCVGGLVRATINPTDGSIARDLVFDRDVEFPRVDDRVITRFQGSIATIGKLGHRDGPMDSLWFFNPDAGSETHWDPGSLSVGEPQYIPGDTGDYWGMVGTDQIDMTSWFVLLPVSDPKAGPLARIRLPHRVPAGLHGTWFANLT